MTYKEAIRILRKIQMYEADNNKESKALDIAIRWLQDLSEAIENFAKETAMLKGVNETFEDYAAEYQREREETEWK